MDGLLPDRLAWYIAGPLLGLVVAGLYAVANRPLGASGPFVQVLTVLRRQPGAEVWRIWFLVGMVFGGLLVAVLRDGPAARIGWGTLGSVLPLPVLAVVLLMGGVLIGYGARWAGGCTSGHGITGNSILSPASLAATATFMVTAIAVTAILHAITGGAL